MDREDALMGNELSKETDGLERRDFEARASDSVLLQCCRWQQAMSLCHVL